MNHSNTFCKVMSSPLRKAQPKLEALNKADSKVTRSEEKNVAACVPSIKDTAATSVTNNRGTAVACVEKSIHEPVTHAPSNSEVTHANKEEHLTKKGVVLKASELSAEVEANSPQTASTSAKKTKQRLSNEDNVSDDTRIDRLSQNVPIKNQNILSPKHSAISEDGPTAVSLQTNDESSTSRKISKKTLFTSRKFLFSNSTSQNRKSSDKCNSVKSSKQDAYDFREDDSDFESPPFPSMLTNRRRNSATSEAAPPGGGGGGGGGSGGTKVVVETCAPSISTTTISSTTTILEAAPATGVENDPRPSGRKRSDAARRRPQARNASSGRDTSPERSKTRVFPP